MSDDQELRPVQRNCCTSCLSRWVFYFGQGCLETKTRTCSYIWGLLSIMLVCAVTSVIISVTEKFPVVILMLCEFTSAEQDLVIAPGDWNEQFGLNTTKISEVLKPFGNEYNNFSPRVNLTILSYNTLHPSQSYYSTLIAMDSEKEKKIELGRSYPFPQLQKGECIITDTLAQQLGVKFKDKITINLPAHNFSSITVSSLSSLSYSSFLPIALESIHQLPVTLTIAGIVPDSCGKTIDEEVIFVEIDKFWEDVVDSFPDSLTTIIPKDTLKKFKLRDYATSIYFSYTIPRYKGYLSFDTDYIKGNLVKWGTFIVNALSFNELKVSMPVGESYSIYSMLGMFIHVISLIIIVVLAFLSVILIYSLLQISVDTRTYELGILRMVGLNRLGIVGIIVAQSLLYSIPGLILGIGLGYGLNVVVIEVIIYYSNVPLDLVMPYTSVLISALVALSISFVSSILPITSALGKNLHDAIDINHSKNQIIQITIERADNLHQPFPLLIGGFMFAGIGSGVYIIFPLSLLSSNITLLGIIFFIMLLLILASLVLITMNFEHLFERIFATVFLFWEKRAIRDIAVKNLGAHRIRNRKTTLLYSVSLSFLVFVNIVLNVAVDMIHTMSYMNHGADIHLYAYKFKNMNLLNRNLESHYDPLARYFKYPEELEEITNQYSDIITNVAWITHEMETVYSQPIRTQIANKGRSHAYYHHIYGVSPNFIDKVNQTYVSIVDTVKTGDSIIKALYTNRGNTFSTSLSSGFQIKMDGKAGDMFMMNIIPQAEFEADGGTTLLQDAASFLDNSLARYNITTTSYIEAIPFFKTPTKTISASSQADAPLSIPSYLSLLPGNLSRFENIRYNGMFITLKNRPNEKRREDLYNKLKSYREDPNVEDSTYFVWAYYKSLSGLTIAMNILNVIMIVNTIVVILLCFFSLMSSMHTNVLEQAKEIGIMRSLGLTRFQMVRVFSEEAFILVLTATLMGLVCGMVVGYLLTSQIGTLQGLPADFYFPWQLVLIVILLSVITSVLSALQPTLSLTKQSIISIIKTV